MALALCLLGGMVIVGWYVKSPTLLQIHPSFAPMQYNTALGFLLCGLGLLAHEFSRPRTITILGALAATIGGLTLVEYGVGMNLGLDELFMKHDITVSTSHPGRMAPNTALCFLLTGTALAFMRKVTAIHRRSTGLAVAGALVAALGAVAFFGYLSQLETAYGWGNLTRMALHTSAGFFLLTGPAVIGVAWRISDKFPSKTPDWLPILPAAIGIAVSVCFWQALTADQSLAVARHTKLVGVGLLDQIRSGLDRRTLALQRMADRWTRANGTEHGLWHADAVAYHRDIQGIQALEWVDRTYHVRWIVPLEGNEAAQDLNLAFEEERRKALEAARNRGSATITSSIDLVQGGKGFLMHLPLFRDEEFDGFLLCVFHLNRLLDSLMDRLQEDHAIEISDSSGTFYARNEAPVSHWDRWGHTESMDSYGVDWTFRVAPLAKSVNAQNSRVPLASLVAGVLGSLMLSGLVSLMGRARKHGRAAALAEQEARQILAKLSATSGRLQRIVENSPTGIIVADQRGVIHLANPMAEKMFGWPGGELIDQSIEVLVPDSVRGHHPKLRDQYFEKPDARPMGANRDLNGHRKDGSVFPVEIGLSPFEAEDGSKHVLTMVSDITLRKNAEIRMQAAVASQRLMLKEIHHRVKNNLQVISSLLNLSAGRIDDAGHRAVFEECVKRVHAMALVHERLYRTSNFAELELGAYLEALAAREIQTAGETSRITMECKLQPVHVSLDQAVPLALIVCELISNARKHAFVDREQGTIELTLASGSNGFRLSVADNGAGVKTGSFAKESQGLMIVEELTKQIRGEYSMETGETGTTVMISAPLPEAPDVAAA